LFLKAIEMYGFKSFMDKTRIEFGEGVTVVVGPNGCGKSNVLDALRWGMGEQRAKQLRGDHMEDVLFNGSDKREPGSAASVTLFLQNTNNILPPEYNEVEVCRKYYRNGSSEFFINKKPVLLKDIQSLFMDTGIGRNSYAFIQQSQVDILLDDNTSKRPIFEEAAGISKYKVRRAETMLKLEKTRENLSRVRDILEEVEKNMLKTRLQAETAEKAGKLENEIKDQEIRLHSLEYRETRGLMQKDQDRESKQKEKNDEFEAELRRLEEKIQEARSRLDLTKESRADSEKEIISLQGKEASLGQKKDHCLAQINDNHRLDEESKILFVSLETKKQNAVEKVKETEARLKANEFERQTQQTGLTSAQKEYEAIRVAYEAAEQEAEELRQKILKLANGIDKTRKHLKDALDEFLAQMDARKDELLSQQDRRKELSVRVAGLFEKLAGDLADVAKSLDAPSPDIAVLRTAFIGARTVFDDLRTGHTELQVLQDAVQALLFDKKGLQGRRDEIEQQIHAMEVEQISAQNRISYLEGQRKTLGKSDQKFREQIGAIQNKLSRLNAEHDGIVAQLENHNGQAKDYEEQILRARKSVTDRAKKNEELNATISQTEKDVAATRERIQKIQRTVSNTGSDLQAITDKMKADQERLDQKKRQLKDLEERRRSFELEVKGHETRLADLRQLMFENYGLNIEDQIAGLPESADTSSIRQRIQKLKSQRGEFGHVNHMAIEEYKDHHERFKHLSSQKQDIEKAEADLVEVIRRINEESEKVFLDTFKKVKEHFVRVIRRLFHGGRADIILLNPEDPLNSEIEIIVQPPGKKNKMSQLSGGEKSLAAIGLVFSIFLIKPSPFCVLDEVEHALDEHNTRQFVGLMKEFHNTVQFLIVTHNKQTMTSADLIYGVTMEEKTDPSVSKVVSLKLAEIDREKYQVRDPVPAAEAEGEKGSES
jgi:chromosome segregation protein